MYDNRLYASGVYGVFIADWCLRCETPLALRNSVKIAYQVHEEGKSRGRNSHLVAREKQSGNEHEHEVSALAYGYKIEGAGISLLHFVPPSSVRGALRSWTINHLVSSKYRAGMTPPAKMKEEETGAYLAGVQTALADRAGGYPRIASLFGLAFDARDAGANLANAGRLRVETQPFAAAQARPVSVNGAPAELPLEPANVRRQMAVRSPIDRVTHASREGGLHHFLEFCKGEVFTVRLTVLNPRESDLGLVALWRRELNTGILRLGALASIGRGRVSIDPDAESYRLWLGPGVSPAAFQKAQPKSVNQASDDALAGLWDAYSLAPGSLEACIPCLEEA